MPTALLAAAPLVLKGGQMVGSAIAGNKKAEADTNAANAFLAQKQAFGQDTADKLAAGGWNLYGKNQLGSGSTMNQTTNQSQSYNNLTMPEWMKADQGTLNTQRNFINDRQAMMTGGYKDQVANAIRNAANQADMMKGRENAVLARRGQNPLQQAGFSPAQRMLNQQALDIQTNLPEQLANMDNQKVMEFLGMVRGQRQKGSSNMVSNTSGSNTGWQDVGPNVAMIQSLLGPQGPQANNAGGLLNALSTGVGAVGDVWGGVNQMNTQNEQMKELIRLLSQKMT